MSSSPHQRLFNACEAGNTAVLERFLDQGADLETKDAHGRTLLAMTASYGKEEATRMLIKRGANMESPNSDGHSPLTLAAIHKKSGAFLTLLAHGANIDSALRSTAAPNFTSSIRECLQFPLHTAAEWGMRHECTLLLKLGYDIEQKDTQGNTALNSAALSGEYSVCQLLLDHGADVASENNNGYSPLDNAAVYESVPTILALIAGGAKVASALALPADFPSSIYQCLTHPLHTAAAFGMTQTCVKMLNLGFDIDDRDAENRTPIECVGDDREEVRAAIRSWAARQVANQSMAVIAKSTP